MLRLHPWIFSGAIAKTDPDVAEGDLVEVCSASGSYLATGHWADGSIRVRILSYQPTEGELEFWIEKLNDAFSVREKIGLTGSPSTNCYRLVNAEGDWLPGLIIDVYGGTAVLQCHSAGMYRQRELIAEAVLKVMDGSVLAVYDKSAETLQSGRFHQLRNGYLAGVPQSGLVLEHGHRFMVNWEDGQKTGFFLDQRENRALLGQYACGKTVLNTFCYTGGFSVYALCQAARLVHSVDVSAKAIDLAIRNVELNKPWPGEHQAFAGDTLEFLKNCERTYDLVIVDPPAFAKNISKRHNAVQGYRRLNAMALRRVADGGLLVTFSCSQVVDRQLFQDTMLAAALEARRPVRILHYLGQPADHPVSLYHPEGAYLKGLVLEVG